MWATLPYMPWIIRLTEMLRTPMDTPAEPVQTVATSGPPSVMLVIIAGIVTAVVIAATLYALIKLPAAVAKSGQKITQTTSAKIIPIVTHHAKLTPKKRRRLTARVIADLKLAICIIPIILSACAYSLSTNLDYDIIMIVAAVLGIGSLLLLSAQLLCAKWLKAEAEAIW